MSNPIIETLRKAKRKFYIMKYRLKNVDKTFIASRGCGISRDFTAGAYSYVGPNCLIYPKVTIGKYTMIAQNVSIIGSDHNYKVAGTPTIFAGRDTLKPTTIGDDVWVGAHSIIMTGVTIGNGAVIAAGSVVTKSIPAYSVWGGVPAKEIEKRFSEEEIQKHEAMLAMSHEELPREIKHILRGKDK